MTKARNIADLLDANGDVKSASLDNVPAVDLTNLSASNLTLVQFQMLEYSFRCN